MSLDITLMAVRECTVFEANITHNLGDMARAAGIYNACWFPEDIHIIQASELIPILKAGLEDLKARPDYFRKFDAPNKWGTYDQFVPWVEKYLAACIENPDAKVYADR